MYIRRDDKNEVVEIIADAFDTKGKPRFHPALMKDIFTVPNAEIGWIFDELAMTCRPPEPIPNDPQSAFLTRMSQIENEYIRALLLKNQQLANALETEYGQLAGSIEPSTPQEGIPNADQAIATGNARRIRSRTR